MKYKKMRKKNMITELKNRENLTKSEIKEAIIELNHYMLTAIDIRDKRSVQEIREEMTELVNLYLGNEDM
jgi:nucleoid DNA-binding protein